MRIWLQNFVSIQPRTSLEKSDVSWPTAQAGVVALLAAPLPEAQHVGARSSTLLVAPRLALLMSDFILFIHSQASRVTRSRLYGQLR